MKKHILPFTAVACIIAVLCMICALTIKKTSDKKFIPPEFDSNAQSGTPIIHDDMGYSELDANEFKVSVCGKLIFKDKKADLYLTNPQSNNVWIKVRMLDENDNMLGETGLIKPGEYVKSLMLDTVPKQSTAVKLKIMAYEPNTYYSAGAVSLNTTLIIG